MLGFSVSVVLLQVLTAVVKLNLTPFFRTVRSLRFRNLVQKVFAESYESEAVIYWYINTPFMLLKH